MSRPGAPWLWGAAIVLTVLFSLAGNWQWQRGLGKDAMLLEQARLLEERRSVALSAAAQRADALDWAVGSGRFADIPPVLLDNQQRDGRVGVRAFRVFVPDAGSALLVDLGWLPLTSGRSMPEVGLPVDGEALEVAGLLSPPPSAGIRLGEGLQRQPDGSLLLIRMETDAIARELGVEGGLAPRVLRLDPAMPLGYERDLDLLANTLPPEKHRGYAIQWYGLAVATVVVTLVLSFRRKTR